MQVGSMGEAPYVATSERASAGVDETGGFRAQCAEPAAEGTGSRCSPQDSGTVQQC